MKKSRSQLYADAPGECLARYAIDEVTGAMDRVLERIGEVEPEPFVTGAARWALERVEWHGIDGVLER